MNYIILGASAAGMNAAETLRHLKPEASITLISTDTAVYSRCMLHYFVAGHRSADSLNFKGPDFFTRYGINWRPGHTVTDLDPDNHQLTLDNSEVLSFDKLLIATGSSPFIPPVENLRQANHVIGLRTFDDCEQIKKLAQTRQQAVVIGGGLIGVDILSGLLPYNLNLSLVEQQDHLLALQLDHHAANRYQQYWTGKGVHQYYGLAVKTILVDELNNPTAVELSNGERIPADFIIVASGVQPNSQFVRPHTLKLTERGGIVTGKDGQTSHPDIFAAGDVTGQAAIWSFAVKQAIAAAHSMSGQPMTTDDFFTAKSTMNFFDLPTVSLGKAALEITNETVLFADDRKERTHGQSADGLYQIDILRTKTTYHKIVHQNGHIYGALIQGDISYAGILTQLIKENIDISKVKKDLFSIDYSDFFHIDKKFEYHY